MEPPEKHYWGLRTAKLNILGPKLLKPSLYLLEKILKYLKKIAEPPSKVQSSLTQAQEKQKSAGKSTD